MKKPCLIILLFSLIFFLEGRGQSYFFINGSTYSVTLDTSKLIYSKGIEIVNTGTTNLNLTWDLTLKDTLIDSHFELCNSGICFNNLPFNGAMPTILPNDTGWIKMHIFTGKATGRNKVKYALKDGAGRVDTLTFIADVVLPNGINEKQISAASIEVFPNPACDFVIVKGTKTSDAEIQFFNEQGSIVTQHALLQGYTSINTDFLHSGQYHYWIKQNNTIIKTGKIIVNTK